MQGHKRQRGKGTWQLIAFVGMVDGKRQYRRRTFHGTAREADTALRALCNEVDADRTLEALAGGTFSDLLARWLDHATPSLEATTLRGYRSKLVRIDAALGSTPTRDLTVKQLEAFYSDLYAEGLSAASVQRHHAMIRRALNVGMRWGEVDRNVAGKGGAEGPRVLKPERDPMPPEVADRLLDLMAETDPLLGLLVTFAADTGARRGEVCGLRWGRVDLDNRRVHIARSVAEVPGGVVEKDTKAHQSRWVTISPDTADGLRRWKADQARTARALGLVIGDGYVFTIDPTAETPTRPDAVSKAWARLCREAGEPAWRLHDLRHYMATVWLTEGVPVSVVSKRLGHRLESTTTDVYSHVMRGADAAASDLVTARQAERRAKALTPG